MRRPAGTLTLDKRKADPVAAGSASDTGFLASSSMNFDTWELADAQRWGDALAARRQRWLRDNARRLPREDELERQHYGKRWTGGRTNG